MTYTIDIIYLDHPGRYIRNVVSTLSSLKYDLLYSDMAVTLKQHCSILRRFLEGIFNWAYILS